MHPKHLTFNSLTGMVGDNVYPFSNSHTSGTHPPSYPITTKQSHMPTMPATLFTCPIARPVVRRPKTRNGCAAAWYLTSLAIGSGMKYLRQRIGGGGRECRRRCLH